MIKSSLWFVQSKVRVCRKCADNQETMHERSSIEHCEKTAEPTDDDDEDDPDIAFEVRSEKLAPHEGQAESAAPDTGPLQAKSKSNQKGTALQRRRSSRAVSNESFNQDGANRPETPNEKYAPTNLIDDADMFTIVSNDEISKTLLNPTANPSSNRSN